MLLNFFLVFICFAGAGPGKDSIFDACEIFSGLHLFCRGRLLGSFGGSWPMFAGIIKWKLGAEHIFVRLVFVERARMERMSLQGKS